MNILVTGGAGYVGSALVPQLLDQGHRVTVLDWFVFRSMQDIDVHSALRMVRGDIRDAVVVREALRGIDTVIHLAAMSNDPSGDLDKALTKAINHDATCALADQAAAAKVKRFINASSASVYGVSDEPRVVESLPLNPQTVYAETKMTSEAYVLSLNSADFTTVSVRPATLHGYAERLRLDLTANIFVAQAIATGTIRIFGGNQYRPNLSILDMIAAYLTLLEVPAALVGGRTFNIAESDHTVRDIATIVRDAVDPSVSLAVTESKDTRSYRLCADLARDVLGLHPKYTLAQSAAHLAAHLRSWSKDRISDPRYRNVEWLKRSPEFVPLAT